ncbi:MAG TPA: cytochrome c biogenesis protein CcdA [Candidatus Eisenbacteria bacterium]|jgi:cytochrome c-type biogenesis protein|nr:cytochrome c biogenesis protein CcdA [Candidatus Eisenbacteria bacterium]
MGTGMFEAQPSQVSLIAAFLAGLVSFVSPCVLPLVPSYVTFITGLSFDELTASEQGPRVRRLTLIHSLAFIFGFSLVFIALGATATATGQFLREHQDTLRIVGGILIVFFGVYLTGLIKIPALSRERKARLTEKPLGVLGSVLVGITFAAGWTPCIGPILASILLYASTAQTVGTGILLLSVYSLGLGVPFLIASLGMNTFLAASKGIRKQLHTIEVVSGVILIVFGLALVTNVFSYFVAFLSRFLPAVG